MAMDTNDSSTSARNRGPSEGHTYQLPSCSPEFETPTSLRQRNIRIPVSPRKSPSGIRESDRSPCKDIPQFRPSSEIRLTKGLGKQRSHDPPSVADIPKTLAANTTQNRIASLGHRATSHHADLGDSVPDDDVREGADEHRLEAAARLAHLLRSKFFENAKTSNEQISLLTSVWTSIREEDVYNTKVPGSVGAEETPVQNETSRRKPESAAILQSLDANGKSLIYGDHSDPRTPDSRGLKRKSSSLTAPFNVGLPQPPDTKALSAELYRLSLGAPPTFNPNISPEQLSSSPMESRRTRPCVRQITSEIELRPAKFAKPSAAGENVNLSIYNDDRATSSIGLQDPPSAFHGNKHKETDNPYDPFTESDHDVTREALLLAGDRSSNMSHSGFTAEETLVQDSKGSLFHNDPPIVRKLSPYTKRPPKSSAPETIIQEAIVKPLTKLEMGIAWKRTSSGRWMQQTSHLGWIYIYQLPNEVNTVKIGITQVSIEDRLDSWTEQCGHKPQIVYPSTESERVPVPNIYRLEALVQAELAATRLEETGCSCGVRHIEWFEEALAHARKVVVKWSEWMRTDPYQEVQPQYWHLSLHYIPDLAELSRPSPRDPAEGSVANPIRI